MINIKNIKIGDIIKYNSNDGSINTREIGGLAPGPAFLVKNDILGEFLYHVYENEIIQHFTPEKDPEYFL